MIVNGHGGNDPVGAMAREYMTQNPGCFVRYHNWFRGKKVWAKVMETDPVASHASWMENFPWTRLPNVETPEKPAPMLDHDRLYLLDAKRLRAYAGVGNWGGDIASNGYPLSGFVWPTEGFYGAALTEEYDSEQGLILPTRARPALRGRRSRSDFAQKKPF